MNKGNDNSYRARKTPSKSFSQFLKESGIKPLVFLGKCMQFFGTKTIIAFGLGIILATICLYVGNQARIPFINKLFKVTNHAPVLIDVPTTTTEVEITYPYDGANVEIGELVRGTSEKIPKGQAIWIIVYPYLFDRYYPQNNPAAVQVNGDWISLTFIGIEEDVNKKFDIIVVLADKRAQDAFNAYLKQAEDTGIWSGLERLPEGATIYDSTTVTRK